MSLLWFLLGASVGMCLGVFLMACFIAGGDE